MYSFNRLLLPTLFLCGSALSNAAPITWSAPVDTNGKADFIEGTSIIGFNGGSQSLTVLDAGASGASDYYFVSTNFLELDFTATGDDAGEEPREETDDNLYLPELIVSTGDTRFDDLISSATLADGPAPGIATGTLTLSGLEVGVEYRVQVFFNDQGEEGRIMTFGDGNGSTVGLLAANPEPGIQAASYGQFAVGTFTADAVTQALTMDSSAGPGSDNVQFNAILVSGPVGTFGNAAITWGELAPTLSKESLIPGIPVYARNAGPADVAIDDTVFKAIRIGGTPARVSGMAGFTSTGDFNFDTLVLSTTFGGGQGPAPLPGLITGLTPGQDYSVQVLYNDQRNSSSGRTMTVSDNRNNTANIDAGAVLGASGATDYGTFVVGTFVAERSTQYLEFAPLNGSFNNSHFNAILVVESEPIVIEIEERITAISYDEDSNEVTLTFTSIPGEFYSIFGATQLAQTDAETTFTNNIDDGIEATTEETTFTFEIFGQLADQPRVFFRVVRNPPQPEE